LLRGHYSASSLLWTPPTPSRLPPISRCFRLYGFLLRRFLHGTRRVSPVARYVLAIVLSLKPRQNANRRVSQVASVHAAFALPARARLLGQRFRGHFCVHFRYGPMTRSPSLQMALSINSRGLVSLRSAIQATRLLTITSVGLFPTEHTSLYWTCTGTRCFSSSSQFRTMLIFCGAPAADASLTDSGFIIRNRLPSGLRSHI
jgi:hypothetical protein